MDIVLIDLNEELVDTWKEHFAGCDDVDIICDDYFTVPADALVSPANSEGFMDGGLDEAIRNVLGYDVEAKVQEKYPDGFLPVGQAVAISLDHPDYDWLISAPTMERPEYVGDTNNAYLAFRAILKCADEIGAERLVCCGLATWTGRMLPDECAYQMKEAYVEHNGQS